MTVNGTVTTTINWTVITRTVTGAITPAAANGHDFTYRQLQTPFQLLSAHVSDVKAHQFLAQADNFFGVITVVSH
jgi:hypothetical protein